MSHKKQSQLRLSMILIDDLIDGPLGEVQCCKNFTNAYKAILFLENLLSLPHLLARKTKSK
jgi:hypothetical protein